MPVSRLVVPGGMVSWTVVGDDGLPVEPIECYLANLVAWNGHLRQLVVMRSGSSSSLVTLPIVALTGARPPVEDVAPLSVVARSRQTSLSSKAALPGARSARSTIIWLLCSAFMGSMPAQGSPALEVAWWGWA